MPGSVPLPPRSSRRKTFRPAEKGGPVEMFFSAKPHKTTLHRNHQGATFPSVAVTDPKKTKQLKLERPKTCAAPNPHALAAGHCALHPKRRLQAPALRGPLARFWRSHGCRSQRPAAAAPVAFSLAKEKRKHYTPFERRTRCSSKPGKPNATKKSAPSAPRSTAKQSNVTPHSATAA